MKKKRSSNSKRVPPSVPKCVRKDTQRNGYVTDFITHNGMSIRFLFQKTNEGYVTSRTSDDTLQWTDMRSATLSPTTRAMFAAKPTLSKAIATVEEYLGFSLPDIR